MLACPGNELQFEATVVQHGQGPQTMVLLHRNTKSSGQGLLATLVPALGRLFTAGSAGLAACLARDRVSAIHLVVSQSRVGQDKVNPDHRAATGGELAHLLGSAKTTASITRVMPLNYDLSAVKLFHQFHEHHLPRVDHK